MKLYSHCPSVFLCFAVVSIVAIIGLAYPGEVFGIDFSKSTGGRAV